MALRTMAVRYVRHRIETKEITPGTGVEHRNILHSFCEAIDGRTLTQARVEAWWLSINHLASGTRRNRLSVIRGFVDWLVFKGHAPPNLFVEIKAPKATRQVHRALNGSAPILLAHADCQRTRLIVLLGLQVGLRRAEIANLQVGDVNWADKIIFIIGKGGHQRFVPITHELEVELRAYLNQYPAKAGPLIRRLDGRGGIGAHMVGRIVTKLAYDAGVKLQAHDGVSCHALRHTAATDVARREKDITIVQQLLGHEHLGTTEIYVAKLPIMAIREAVEGRCYTCATDPCKCNR